MDIADSEGYCGIAAVNFIMKTFVERVNMVQNDSPRMIGKDWKWYLLWKLYSVPHRLLPIQTTAPLGLPALTSAIQRILVVTMPRVIESFNSAMNKIPYVTGSKPENMLRLDNSNSALKNLNTRINNPENRCIIDLML